MNLGCNTLGMALDTSMSNSGIQITGPLSPTKRGLNKKIYKFFIPNEYDLVEEE